MERVALIIVTSYLLGAIPVAYLVARLSKVNIFEVGSGNMGTTNVIRAVGPRMGILVLLLDMFKGIIAILISRALLPSNPDSATVLSAVMAITGHNWSIFARLVTGKLSGGKGAATAFGTFVMIAPYYVLIIMIVTGLAVLAKTRYMSLAVLTMIGIAVPSMMLAALLPNGPVAPIYLVYTFVLTGLLLYRFRGNIQRLMAGNERRVGERA